MGEDRVITNEDLISTTSTINPINMTERHVRASSAGLTVEEMMELSYPNAPEPAPLREMNYPNAPEPAPLKEMNEEEYPTPELKRSPGTSKTMQLFRRQFSKAYISFGEVSPPQPFGRRNKSKGSQATPISPADPEANGSGLPHVVPSIPFLEFKILSSEIEPSQYQVDIPKKADIVACGRLCQFMHEYKQISNNYPFDLLKGGPLATLNCELLALTDSNKIGPSNHQAMIHKLKECGFDDLVVDGFIRHEFREGAIEVLIVSSEQLRQMIVCINAIGDEQLIKKTLKGGETSEVIDENTINAVKIHTTLHDAFINSGLKERLFKNLGNLERPFFDIVFTGHSFGAAIATLAALTYADKNPQLRISANVYGCPRIGKEPFRRWVHSLPNLRVFRLENPQDFALAFPGGKDFMTVGHGIQINAGFKVYRFDNFTPSKKLIRTPLDISRGKADHKINSYVEKLTAQGESWMTDFCDLNGQGVVVDNEKRSLS